MSNHVQSSHALILASQSPRRLDLLAQIGVHVSEVAPSDIDEIPLKDEQPSAMAKRLAVAKARHVAALRPGVPVLAADTVVAVGLRILGKPENEMEARKFLQMLSGRKHRVYGGVALVDATGTLKTRLVKTSVTFKRLDAGEMNAYLACGEWQGKAGGYAIQGRAGAFVRQLVGSYSNVVGLPLFETANMLKGAGIFPIVSAGDIHG